MRNERGQFIDGHEGYNKGVQVGSNVIEDKGDYCIVHLNSKKYLNEFALVDKSKLYEIERYTWSPSVEGVNNKRIYAATRINGKIVKMHQIILPLTEEEKKNMIVRDHVNGNTLDNRISNLRKATFSQNSINTTKRKGTSSKFIGVSWFERDNNWRVRVSINKKSKTIGYYESEVEAAHVFNIINIKYNGEYAAINTFTQEEAEELDAILKEKKNKEPTLYGISQRPNGKWTAVFRKNGKGKTYTLGIFPSKEEAAFVRDVHVVEYAYGNKLNFPYFFNKDVLQKEL